MKYRRIIPFLITFLLLSLFLTSCSGSDTLSETETVESEEETESLSFDEILDLSNSIFVGSYMETISYESYAEHRFIVIEPIWGKVDYMNIFLYQALDEAGQIPASPYQLGERYLLVTQREDSPFYDHPRYQVTNDLFLHEGSGTFTLNGEPITLPEGNDLRSYVLERKGDAPEIPTYETAAAEMVAESEVIAKVTVLSLEEEALVHVGARYQCKIEALYKDTTGLMAVGGTPKLMLRRDMVEVGESYILGVSRPNETSLFFSQATRESILEPTEEALATLMPYWEYVGGEEITFEAVTYWPYTRGDEAPSIDFLEGDHALIRTWEELNNHLFNHANPALYPFVQKVEGVLYNKTMEADQQIPLSERYDPAFFETHALYIQFIHPGHGNLPYVSSITLDDMGFALIEYTVGVSFFQPDAIGAAFMVAEIEKGALPNTIYMMNSTYKITHLPLEMYSYDGKDGVYIVAPAFLVELSSRRNDKDAVGFIFRILESKDAGEIELCYYKAGFPRPNAAYTEERTTASGETALVGFDANGTWQWVDFGDNYGAINHGLTEETAQNDWLSEQAEAYGVEDGIMHSALEAVLSAHLGLENKPESIMLLDWWEG
ncbi:MAG: hypothetical protein IJB51_06610 [Clostridia bacterium]|nr:hypothetical protein [Clostridia bacterium]